MSNMPKFPAETSRSRYLTQEQTQQFAKELEALRDNIMAKVGEEDANYIRSVARKVRNSEIAGRTLLGTLGWLPPAWLAGVALLSFSKIVDNMELGHNVMHGQFDFMNDPNFSGANFEWDNACAGPLWKHYHNYMHHTYTNILGKDHDVGYNLVRMSPEQAWGPSDLFNLPKTVALALLFQWAVGYHDIQVSVDEYKDDPQLNQIMKSKTRTMLKKMGRQVVKDYVFFPAISTVNFIPAFTGNLTANVARNVWSWGIIFCGHFTAEAEMFENNIENETRGEWYIRQIKGSSNITGGKFFHFMTGNLSHQIEHHVFPDMSSLRYQELAPQLKSLCEKYGINYNTGSLSKQLTEVMIRIAKYSVPSKKDLQEYRQAKIEHKERQYQIEPAKLFFKGMGLGLKDAIPNFIKNPIKFMF